MLLCDRGATSNEGFLVLSSVRAGASVRVWSRVGAVAKRRHCDTFIVRQFMKITVLRYNAATDAFQYFRGFIASLFNTSGTTTSLLALHHFLVNSSRDEIANVNFFTTTSYI